MIKLYLLATLASLLVIYIMDKVTTRAKKITPAHYIAQMLIVWIAAAVQIIYIFFFLFQAYAILKTYL